MERIVVKADLNKAISLEQIAIKAKQLLLKEEQQFINIVNKYGLNPGTNRPGFMCLKKPLYFFAKQF